MNIGIFTDCYYPQINGVVTSAVTLKEELEKRGHNVTIVTVKIPGLDDEPGIIRIPSIPFRKWKEFRIGIYYPVRTLNKIRKLKFDIIHTQTEFSVGLMAKLIGKILGIPVIHTYHTMYEDYTHYAANLKINRKIIKELSKIGSRIYVNECAGVIAPSVKTKEALLSYGVKKPIEIIPTGINLDNFKKGRFSDEEIRAKRQSLGINENDAVFLYLGRISQEKSIDVIISKLQSILKEYKNTKLLLVGDGPEKNNLENLARSLDLASSVIFTGRVPWHETGLYYQLSDLFITASVTETQGLTIYEAMAAGIPVIAKKDDNFLEVISDKINGRIFESDDALPEIIKEYLDDKASFQSIAQKGLECAFRMSSEYFAEKVEALYMKVLREKSEKNLKIEPSGCEKDLNAL